MDIPAGAIMQNGQTESSLTANPYAANLRPNDVMIVDDRRPSGVTAVGVLCIVGGIVGTLSGLFSLLNLFFAASMSGAFMVPGPQQAAQEQFNAQLLAIGNRYFVPNLLASSGTLLIGSCLLLGGIGVFRAPPWGRTWIRRTLLAAILLECLKAVLYTVTQLEMVPVMEKYMQRLMTAQGANAAPMAMGTMMKVMSWVGIGMWLLWTLVKVGLYIAGRRYLRRTSVIDYFSVAAPED